MPETEQLELKKDDKEDGETGCDDVPAACFNIFNIHALLNKKETDLRGQG